ncbi:MAG: dienelactone hydrolase family protein [Bacteroidota bacterium]
MNLYTRLFLLTTLFCFALACGEAPSQAENEETSEEVTAAKPTSTIKGQAIDYQTDSTTMKGYLAYDESVTGKRPGVLVVHEWWGHNDYARQRADMLAEMGYVALAVDMYGDGQQADHPDDAGKFAMSVVSNFSIGEARFLAAIETLKANPQVDAESLAAIGYCFGGGVVLSMANTGMEDLDAVVSFHGGLGLAVMPEAGKVNPRVLVCNGADDPFISAEQIDTYTTAMDEAGAQYEFINYPGAKHAFTNKAADANGEKFDLPLAYNQAADEQSWAAMTTLFTEVFGQE